jgi:CMP-N,N'-diacetyllegionaminic acid synthase
MKFLCLIPARKNSKGVKKKNLKLFNKKPLLYWTINIAKKCNYFDRIILSTDCKLISNLGKKYGVEVPFIRPKNISKDSTEMLEVAKHLKKFLKKNNYFFDALVILQPTSPLRSIKILNKVCDIFSSNRYDSLISIIPTPHQFNNNLRLKEVWKNEFILKNNFISLRNKIKNNYTSDGGNFFITKYKNLEKYIIGGKIYGYKIPQFYSLDINNNYDFKIGEVLQKNKHLKKIE